MDPLHENPAERSQNHCVFPPCFVWDWVQQRPKRAGLCSWAHKSLERSQLMENLKKSLKIERRRVKLSRHLAVRWRTARRPREETRLKKLSFIWLNGGQTQSSLETTDMKNSRVMERAQIGDWRGRTSARKLPQEKEKVWRKQVSFYPRRILKVL